METEKDMQDQKRDNPEFIPAENAEPGWFERKIGVTLGLAAGILGLFYWLNLIFVQLQGTLLVKPGDLMVVQSGRHITAFILLGVGLLGVILYQPRFAQKAKRLRLPKFLPLLVYGILFLLVFSFLFFNYTVINASGLEMHTNPLEQASFCPWSGVQLAVVKLIPQYQDNEGFISVKHYVLQYIILLKTGVRIELHQSQRFYSAILAVDATLRKNHVEIRKDRYDGGSIVVQNGETIDPDESRRIVRKLLNIDP